MNVVISSIPSLLDPTNSESQGFLIIFPNFVISRIFGEFFGKKEEAKLVKFTLPNFWLKRTTKFVRNF